MAERTYDKLLSIKTVGIREWRDKSVSFNRYEATPYKALDILFKSYKIKKTDKVVDFGGGRGRVIFYIHNRFKVPVTGIEVHDITYDEAINNKSMYRYKNKDIEAPIKIKYCLAEDYEIKPSDNKFYFFNPFKVDTFKKVVDNILDSVQKHKRTVDIILYYPMPKYKEFLKNETPFKLINKIRLPKANDSREKFLIYRLREEDIDNIGE